MKQAIKLRQAQVWQLDGEYLRIVRLERMNVEYKSTLSLTAKKGTHHTMSKKEFCRLIKRADLLTLTNSPSATTEADAAASAP